jgi:hypothetical protein
MRWHRFPYYKYFLYGQSSGDCTVNTHCVQELIILLHTTVALWIGEEAHSLTNKRWHTVVITWSKYLYKNMLTYNNGGLLLKYDRKK